MKYQTTALANTFAITVGIIYIVCALAIALLPDLTMTIAKSWFHGIDLSKIYYQNITPGSLVLGFVTSIVGAWLVGYLFATIYNLSVKK